MSAPLLDRRTILQALAVFGATTACAGNDNSGGGGSTTSTTAVTPATAPTVDLPAGVFGVGIASGDPTASAVVLWTRLCPEPLSPTGGSPTEDVALVVDVATDEAFEHLVVSTETVARGALAGSVHVDVTGLDPDRWYFYRFRAGDQTSPVGRTRTMPKAGTSPDNFTFVFASCQDFQWGRYGAWRRAVDRPQLDLVVFLGDYIYELSLGDLSPTKDGSRVWAAPSPTTVADYRWRYAQTKTDPLLQAAHARAPWLTTFDDHEVANNYAGDVAQADITEPKSRDRRVAAYQAWYEHTPIRLDPAPTDFAELTVNRSVQVGDLATIYAIETRQWADPPPCRVDASLDSDGGPDCADSADPDRTNLGNAQETWLHDSLVESTSTWNVIANPIMMAGLNIGTAAAPEFERDTWDGYRAARQRLLDTIEENDVSNPVVVTGDWHATFVLDVNDPNTGDLVMTEFLASSISTVLFDTDYSAENPQVEYFHAAHGYGVVEITEGDLVCTLEHIDDVWNDDPALVDVTSWKVTAGSPQAERVDA